MQIKETELNLFDSVESLIEKIQAQPVDSDVLVIVIKTDNKTMGVKQKSFDTKIWGKSILDWTKSAFGNCEIKEVDANLNSTIQSLVTPLLNNKKWTAIFYADTPLLSRKTFLSLLDYAQTKCLEALKLPRGYIFNTEFLKTAQNLSNTQKTDLFADEFFAIFNLNHLQEASKTLKSRILAYHKQNGVQILDDNTTFIDADVDIESDVVIYPNNVLEGKTIVKSGTTILPFCHLKDCTVNKNCSLGANVAENFEFKENTKTKPFEVFGGEK